jgi:hypothetical protein
MLEKRWARLAVALGIVAAFAGGLVWGALQPWTANHFGYALPGDGGLPTYLFENGRRYQSVQVCARAGWCEQERIAQGIPRCYTQANLQDRYREWPLVQVDTISTLFGAAHPIMQRSGIRGVTTPYYVLESADCYVMYELEGGP